MRLSILVRARRSEGDLAVVSTTPDECFQTKCFLLLINLKPWLSQSFLMSDAFILARHVNVLAIALGVRTQATLVGFWIVGWHWIDEPCQEACGEAR